MDSLCDRWGAMKKLDDILPGVAAASSEDFWFLCPESLKSPIAMQDFI